MNHKRKKQKMVVFQKTLSKAPCKRTQHVGATSSNIVGIVLADVGFRVFKRSHHVGQCCFYGNTEGSLVWYLPKTLCETAMLSRSSATMTLDEYRQWKMRKCIDVAIFLFHLENTPSHINKNRELKQRRRECHWERCKTIDLITEYNHFMWECNHLAHRSPENKRNVGICWAKSLTGFKLDATYVNIMKHNPTWCTNERNMLCPTCWNNMLRSFARALNYCRTGCLNPLIEVDSGGMWVNSLTTKRDFFNWALLFSLVPFQGGMCILRHQHHAWKAILPGLSVPFWKPGTVAWRSTITCLTWKKTWTK